MRMLALLVLAAADLAAQSGGAVSGCVVSSTHGEPIAGATVTLRATAGDPGETYIAKTDGNGCFSMNGVAPGAYEARPSKTGFEQRLPGHAEELPSVSIAAGKPAAPIQLTLIPDGVIAGAVIDSTGDPVRQANVELQQSGYLNGKKQLRSVRSARADDRGQYRVFHIPPGKYRLRASPAANNRPQFRSFNGPVAAAAEQDSGLADAWYPGAADAAHAGEIEVAPGAEIDGIDLHLSEQRLYSIRGRILSSADARAGMNVFAQAIGNPGRPLPTRFDGKQYEISGVAPGSYAVIGQQFPGLNSSNAERQYAHQVVEVVNRDVEGVDLAFEPGANIKGVVKAEGTADLQNMNVNLMPLDSASSLFSAGGRVDADGVFKIQTAPGIYRAQVFGQGIYLKSLAVGKENVPDFKVDTAHLTGDLTLVVANDYGKIDGTVMDESGKPVSNATVILQPAHPRDGSVSGIPSLTNANGKFNLPSIIPGDYRAFAWVDVEQGAWEDPDFRKPYEDRAVRVQVAPDSKQSLELRAIRAVN